MEKADETQSNTLNVYQQTNQWLQNMAIKAGAGRSSWLQKPSVNDAKDIVDAFLSYQKTTTGTLEQFMDNYLQFERTGRTFHTEHAMTKAVMETSSSRSIPVDKYTVAFVSTSAQAVSSDAMFLRITLDAMETGCFGDPLLMDSSVSIQSGQSSNQHLGVSTSVGIGASILSIFKASAAASAGMEQDNQTLKQISVKGKSGIDAKDRSVLSSLSAVYALEKSGILPEGQLMNSLTRLSEIYAEKTGDSKKDIVNGISLLSNPEYTVGVINDAIRQERQIQAFLLPFCADHLRASQPVSHTDVTGVDRDDAAFWSEALMVLRGDRTSESTLKMLTRYVDHHDNTEASMLVALIRMQRILSSTRKAVAEFLLTSETAIENDHQSVRLQDGDAVLSMAVSPLIGADKVLVVTQGEQGDGLHTKIVNLWQAVQIFPELLPVATEDVSYHVDCGLLYRAINRDHWEDALDIMKAINRNLITITANGQQSVVRPDTDNPYQLSLHTVDSNPFLENHTRLDFGF